MTPAAAGVIVCDLRIIDTKVASLAADNHKVSFGQKRTFFDTQANSALGHKRTIALQQTMFALRPKADMHSAK